MASSPYCFRWPSPNPCCRVALGVLENDIEKVDSGTSYTYAAALLLGKHRPERLRTSFGPIKGIVVESYQLQSLQYNPLLRYRKIVTDIRRFIINAMILNSANYQYKMECRH